MNGYMEEGTSVGLSTLVGFIAFSVILMVVMGIYTLAQPQVEQMGYDACINTPGLTLEDCKAKYQGTPGVDYRSENVRPVVVNPAGNTVRGFESLPDGTPVVTITDEKYLLQVLPPAIKDDWEYYNDMYNKTYDSVYRKNSPYRAARELKSRPTRMIFGSWDENGNLKAVYVWEDKHTERNRYTDIVWTNMPEYGNSQREDVIGKNLTTIANKVSNVGMQLPSGDYVVFLKQTTYYPTYGNNTKYKDYMIDPNTNLDDLLKQLNG